MEITMANNESFLPEDYLQKKIAIRTNVICVTLFLVVMVGVVAVFFVSVRQDAEVRKLQDKVGQQYQEAALRIEQLDQLQKDKELMRQRSKVAEVLVERVPRSVILAELTNLMPSSLSLLEFEMETKVLKTAPRPLTAIQREAQKNQKNNKKKTLAKANEPVIKPTELNLTLIGVAPTDLEVSQFLAMLNRHELFENIYLRYSEGKMIQEQEMRQFEVELTLNQNIPLHRLNASQDLVMDPMGETVQYNEQGQRTLPEANLTPASNTTSGKDQE